MRALLVVRGGTVFGPEGPRAGDVLIDGELIAAVGPELEAPAAEVIDARGALVIPGAIDAHTHLDLELASIKAADDFPTGTVAAAFGGTTCIVDFAGSGRERPREALAKWKAKAERGALIDFGFHMTITEVPEDTNEAADLFSWLVSEGIVSVKLYMAYPERLMVDDATLGRAFQAAAATGVQVCVHAEDGLEAERRTNEALEAGERAPGTIRRTRPPEVEAAAVERAVGLARAAGSSVYVVHLSSAEGLEAAKRAGTIGKDVFLETCSQYIFLTGECLEGDGTRAAEYVCTPPLRESSDVAALRAALGNGEVSVLATDHCPFTTADRLAGVAERAGGFANFTEIPGGLAGVETRLGLAYQGVVEGWLSPERWVESVAGEPARRFGLDHRKGALAPGLDADVVIFDPGASRTIRAADLHTPGTSDPYDGFEVTGWPATTISRGRVLVRDGRMVADDLGWGSYVPRVPLSQ